jgi:ABC-type sugar transport system permease subunit
MHHLPRISRFGSEFHSWRKSLQILGIEHTDISTFLGPVAASALLQHRPEWPEILRNTFIRLAILVVLALVIGMGYGAF